MATRRKPVTSVADDIKEQRARSKDARKQEQAGAVAHPVGRMAPDFIHAVRPDGVEVVFLPGELLPEWVELP
jgi:hypothetical protein